MKVLQVAPFPQRRGAEVFAGDLNHWLDEQGHQVLTLYLYHYLHADALRPATPYTSAMAHYRSRLEKLPGLNPRLCWFLLHTIGLFQPDIVQVNGGRALKYGAFASAASKRNFALVYRSIGSPRFWEKSFLGRNLARYATARADAVVAVSDATLSEFGPNPGPQIRRRIHRGSALSVLRASAPLDRARLSTPSDAKVLIYVGSLSFEKGPLRAIEVFSRLAVNHPNLYLWMLGDGPQKEDCRRLARERGVADRLRLTGTVQDVAPYLKAADLHLLTSETEGLPGCLVESAALGVPCLAANVGGVREIALDGETGYVVPHDRVEEYVSGARRLLEDPTLHRQFAARARQWAENFSIKVVAPQYLALYEELLERRG